MGRKGESLGRGVKYVGKGVRSKGGERAKEGTRGRSRKMGRGRVWGEMRICRQRGKREECRVS